MRKRNFLKKSNLYIYGFAIVGAILLVFSGWRLKTYIANSNNIKADVKNGTVVMKSFQHIDPTQQNEIEVVARRPTDVDKFKITKSDAEKNAATSRSTKRKINPKREANVKINDLDLYWQKRQYAVKSQTAKENSNSVSPGYKIVESSAAPAQFGIFDSSKLSVLTNSYGIEKLIVTGAFIVETNARPQESYVESVAKKFNLKVKYIAPQINIFILQALTGQNLLKLQQQMAAEPELKSVKLEVLGPGVRAQ